MTMTTMAVAAEVMALLCVTAATASTTGGATPELPEVYSASIEIHDGARGWQPGWQVCVRAYVRSLDVAFFRFPSRPRTFVSIQVRHAHTSTSIPPHTHRCCTTTHHTPQRADYTEMLFSTARTAVDPSTGQNRTDESIDHNGTIYTVSSTVPLTLV